jgi:hypothetical protein
MDRLHRRTWPRAAGNGGPRWLQGQPLRLVPTSWGGSRNTPQQHGLAFDAPADSVSLTPGVTCRSGMQGWPLLVSSRVSQR